MSDPEQPIVVAGLTPLSTVDWPRRLAATVFTQGCPWKCGYCHNPGLTQAREIPPRGTPTWGDVLDFLTRRQGLLDGLVFSGGEPTLQQGLARAMDDVGALGFGVGLHTGGPWPGRLSWLLPRVDWVGLDIKHVPDRYEAVTGVRRSGAAAWRSLDAVLDSGVDHEVRTTVDPTVHTRDDILELGARLRDAGVMRWVLQEARSDGATPSYGEALDGRRLSDVLLDIDFPGVVRRVA